MVLGARGCVSSVVALHLFAVVNRASRTATWVTHRVRVYKFIADSMHDFASVNVKPVNSVLAPLNLERFTVRRVCTAGDGEGKDEIVGFSPASDVGVTSGLPPNGACTVTYAAAALGVV